MFIGAGLKTFLPETAKIRILEVGLGTGLNVLLSALHHGDASIEYTTLETDPLPPDVVRQLDYAACPGGPDAEGMQRLHAAAWDEPFVLQPDFTVTKLRQSVLTFTSPEEYDLVYYDAFSPTVQPELWTPDVFGRIFTACRPEAVMVTYSSKGAVRRAMTAAGFVVEKIPGPPGKREMVRARKPAA